jgi:hypothetical protein
MNVRELLLNDQSKCHAHHHSTSKCELTLICAKFKQLPINLPINNLAFGSLQNKKRPVNVCQIILMNWTPRSSLRKVSKLIVKNRPSMQDSGIATNLLGTVLPVKTQVFIPCGSVMSFSIVLVPGRLSLSQPFHPQTLVLVHLPPSGSILSLPSKS